MLVVNRAKMLPEIPGIHHQNFDVSNPNLPISALAPNGSRFVLFMVCVHVQDTLKHLQHTLISEYLWTLKSTRHIMTYPQIMNYGKWNLDDFAKNFWRLSQVELPWIFCATGFSQVKTAEADASNAADKVHQGFFWVHHGSPGFFGGFHSHGESPTCWMV